MVGLYSPILLSFSCLSSFYPFQFISIQICICTCGISEILLHPDSGGRVGNCLQRRNANTRMALTNNRYLHLIMLVSFCFRQLVCRVQFLRDSFLHPDPLTSWEWQLTPRHTVLLYVLWKPLICRERLLLYVSISTFLSPRTERERSQMILEL